MGREEEGKGGGSAGSISSGSQRQRSAGECIE